MINSGLYGESLTAAVLQGVDSAYEEIDRCQQPWKAVTPAPCPESCGDCCVDFEPEPGEAELVYLAAWLLEYQPETAGRLIAGTYEPLPGVHEKGCIFYNPDSPLHCTVYGGRALICRLFGFCGDHTKDGTLRWKPCRFQPVRQTTGDRQFFEEEMKREFGALPPDMSRLSAYFDATVPGGNSGGRPLRESLVPVLKKLKMLLELLNRSQAEGENNRSQLVVPVTAGQTEYISDIGA